METNPASVTRSSSFRKRALEERKSLEMEVDSLPSKHERYVHVLFYMINIISLEAVNVYLATCEVHILVLACCTTLAEQFGLIYL